MPQKPATQEGNKPFFLTPRQSSAMRHRRGKKRDILPFPEADLRAPYNVITVPAGNNSVIPPSGKDALIDLQDIERNVTLGIWGWSGQRIRVINGWWNVNVTWAAETSAYWHGGPRIRSQDGLGPEHVSLRRCLLEGPTLGDGITIDGGSQGTKLTILETRIQYPTSDMDISPSTDHLDAVQTQGPTKAVEIGLCTVYAAPVLTPGERGKGPFVQKVGGGGVFPVDLRKVNLYAPAGNTGALLFQDTRDLLVTLEDVWGLKDGATGNQWASGSGLFYPDDSVGAAYSWISSGTAPNRVADWTNDGLSGIIGIIREGRPGGVDFVTRASLGH